MPLLELPPVDGVEVLSLMDNSLDVLMASTPIARRAPLLRDKFLRPQLRAEHGVAMLVTVRRGQRQDSFLFDVGVSKDGVLHNMDVLEVRPGEVHAIVLSHGHTDHSGGMDGLLSRLGRRRLPILLHPDALLKRKIVFPDGREVDMIPPHKKDLEQEGIEVVQERGPSYLLDGHVLITGQIARTTPFEKGFPPNYAEIEGRWQPDPWIYDDQAVVMHLRGKGLVVITGCGHAGLINTLRHARRVTGIEEISAVIGGFHLTGSLFEPIIGPTVKALKRFRPQVVVPEHCTGWKATLELARLFPEAFVPNSVGTRLVLTGVEASPKQSTGVQ